MGEVTLVPHAGDKYLLGPFYVSVCSSVWQSQNQDSTVVTFKVGLLQMGVAAFPFFSLKYLAVDKSDL